MEKYWAQWVVGMFRAEVFSATLLGVAALEGVVAGPAVFTVGVLEERKGNTGRCFKGSRI